MRIIFTSMLTAALLPGAVLAQGFDPPPGQAEPNVEAVTALPPIDAPAAESVAPALRSLAGLP